MSLYNSLQCQPMPEKPFYMDFSQRFLVCLVVSVLHCRFTNYRNQFMTFFAPSHKAISTPRRQMERKYNFPFDVVPLGLSFSVGKDEVLNINVLRTLANRYGKKLGRQFKVVDHGEHGFEVFYKSEVAQCGQSTETKSWLPQRPLEATNME